MSSAASQTSYHTITPYLVIRDVARELAFVAAAFDARETLRMERPNGTIAHAEVMIGDSVVMMGEPESEHELMPAMLSMRVDDVDAAYQRALTAGAESTREPADQSYGERSAGVRDATGTIWYLAAPL
ncbi:MAG: VOC family protein [Ktedonobacterales bacterium]